VTRGGVRTVIQFLISHSTEYKYCFDAQWSSITEEQKENTQLKNPYASPSLHMAQPEETWHELLNFGLCDLLLMKNIFRTFALEE